MEREIDEQEEEEEDLSTFEDSEIRESKRRSWWKRAYSLLMPTESNAHFDRRQNDVVSPLDRLVIHPDNWWYVAWTHFILIWAVYSSFFTPFEFGFFRGLPEDLFLLDTAGQFAFLIDIFVRFFVAYRDFHSHRMVYQRSLIALRYVKSRFTVDLLGCLPWDAIYKRQLLQEQFALSCYNESNKIATIRTQNLASGRKETVRYLLWIRLSRACRVTEFFERLEKDIRVNYLFTRIAKLFVVELYCTHAAACFVYYLATTVPGSEEGYTWIGSLKMGDYAYSHFRDIDLWKRYVTSLYFSVVTMATVGYGDIHAVNVREMIFIMIYISLDMILGAYLLGNIAALVVKGSNTEKFRDKMTDLTKYMSRNKLDKKLSKKIKDHLRLQFDRSYTEASVLKDIPVSIQIKISQNLYESYIKEVLIFKGCSTGFIKQIAINVHEEFFLPGEVIIEQGNVMDQLYVVCHGLLDEVGSAEKSGRDDVFKKLRMHSSFGEVSFLCNTPQACKIVARELSRVLRLDKKSFMDILKIYFLDGRVILNNLLEGNDSSLRKKLMESDITLFIATHELELAARLNCAVHVGDLYQVKCLIEAGANPKDADYDGRSALHIASSKGYEDIAVFLIEQGASVNLSDKFGNTPLLEAIKNGHDPVVSLLKSSGASLTVDDPGGFLCDTVARRNVELLKRVLSEDMNPNTKNYDLRTPLHLAASEGLYLMAEVLLNAGASVVAKDRWGNTPVDEARIGGNKKLINLLEFARNI